MNRVLLVDDLPASLDMLEAAVRRAFPGARCTRADSIQSGLGALRGAAFDLALVDLGLPDGNGAGLIAQISAAQPDCTVVVATIHADDDHVFPALQAGAQGYVLKDESTDWLAAQLVGIAEGRPPLSPAIARRLLQYFHKDSPVEAAAQLSPREREVLVFLAQGIQLAGIATRLGITRHTVADHVKNIYRKLNIGSRAEAALQARKLGLA